MTHHDFRALCAEKLKRALVSVSGGLCSFSAGGKHQYLLDVQKILRDIETALAAPQQGAQGLHGKYIIHRSADGSAVEFPCFVLRVDGADDAAMAAIQAYARHPDCPPELAADLAKHVKRNASFAALSAAPQRGAPSDDEMRDIFYQFSDSGDDGPAWVESEQFIAAARAILARHAPTRQPVPVSERLPREGDCDVEGRCWFFFLLSNDPTWTLEHHTSALCSGRSHWLPHWALPLPQSEMEA